MKKFAAHYVFPITSAPIKKGIVKTDHTGTIIHLIDPKDNFQEESGLEFHNGIICPDFVAPKAHFNLNEFINQFQFLSNLASFSIDELEDSKKTLNLLKNIQQKEPNLELEKLIRVFSLEMAKANGLEKKAGSLEINKRPGLIVISGIDFKNMRLTVNSFLKKLI